MNKRAPKRKKPIPAFADENEERRFWTLHDASDFFDWDRAVQPGLPAVKPTTESISLRLPVSMLEELKALANGRDVPYQSLMKVFLAERIRRERGRKAS